MTIQLMNETFNPQYINTDGEDTYLEPLQLDMFKDYTMAIVVPRDEDDEFWFSDYCASVYIGTDYGSVEDKFLFDLKSHPTNVGRFLLVEQPLYKLYNKETSWT